MLLQKFHCGKSFVRAAAVLVVGNAVERNAHVEVVFLEKLRPSGVDHSAVGLYAVFHNGTVFYVYFAFLVQRLAVEIQPCRERLAAVPNDVDDAVIGVQQLQQFGKAVKRHNVVDVLLFAVVAVLATQIACVGNFQN